MTTTTIEPAALGARMQSALEELEERGAVERLWARDHTLWQDDPTEVADRLGWLDSPTEMRDRVGDLEAFAAGVAGNGISRTVLLGMGGSSLFPEVMAATFGDGSGAPPFTVLDTTDPGAIARLRDELDLDETLFVAASKSGTTIETRSQLGYFWDLVGKPEQFAVITDPGSPLSVLARDRGFRAVFENRSDIGGRFSALSLFGLVPASLVGVEIGELLDRARVELRACRAPVPENPGARLASLLAAAVGAGRDKLTLRLAPGVASFGGWIEQLVAESTGKQGTGIVPVDGEGPRRPRDYGDDRVFALLGDVSDATELGAGGHPVVATPIDDPYGLGGEVIRWEVATALAGVLLGINPFDQPDVQAAKDATNRVLREGVSPVEEESPHRLLDGLRPGDYLVIQAFVDPGSPTVDRLREVADRLGREYRVAATVGVGPRYLHSTGQLHKGGPPTGVFLQVVGDDPVDVEIPGAGYGFSTLKRAQAAGDLEALRSRGLRAARVGLEELLERG